MEAPTPSGPPVVGLSFAAPEPEVRRATVGFRLILAFPHLLFLALLGFAAGVTAVVGWFAALFTGRLPDGIAGFQGSVVQYATRVYGYMYLLTDEYPPFALDGAAYPISVALPARGTLNRLAVLFRIVLAIPAMVLSSLVSSGLQPVLLVVWLIQVVSGKRPTPAFEAGAAVLRYQTRFHAWMFMLTSEYPKALFGDPALGTGPSGFAPAPDAVVDVASEIPPPPPAPGAIPPPPPPPGVPAAPRITALVLSPAARRIVIVAIVLGVLTTGGQIGSAVAISNQATRSLDDVDDEYEDLVDASFEYGAAIQACSVSGDGSACVAQANREFAEEVRELEADLSALDLPGGALDEADTLRDHARSLADLLEQMAASVDDPATYEQLSAQFQTQVTELDDDYVDLRQAVLFG